MMGKILCGQTSIQNIAQHEAFFQMHLLCVELNQIQRLVNLTHIQERRASHEMYRLILIILQRKLLSVHKLPG